MNRPLVCLFVFVLCCATGCKEPVETPPEATAPTWSVDVAALDSTNSDATIEVKVQGSQEFVAWEGGKPIPGRSTLRTGDDVKATIALGDGTITMNHSTTVELSEASELKVLAGQAVLTSNGGKTKLVLPMGEVLVGAGKFAATISPKQNTLTVARGIATIDHSGASTQAHAGDEVILREGNEPRVTQSPNLGQAVSWSQIGESEIPSALPEVPRGLGKLVGKVPNGEAEHRLDLVNHHVDVKIQGNLAYTEITESFRNPTSQPLEGLYRFPLPPDARISRLSLKVGDKWMEGEFLETNRADRIWRDIIHNWWDPAMLKWKEGNTFELRIFPILAKQTRVVKIGYMQRLEPSAGGYTYTYPMPVDRAGVIPAKKFEVSGQILGHDATQPLEITGYAGKLEQGATAEDKAVAKFSYEEEEFVARGDFKVRFGRADAEGMRTYNFKDGGEDPFSLVVLRPDLPSREETKPRDFVLVADRSLSRAGAALDIQREIIPRIIEEMDPLDRFTVVACNERCAPVSGPKFKSPSRAASEDIATALKSLDASGGSYPVEAVRVAGELFRNQRDDAREAHVIYFTDGVASIGELRPGPLADGVRRTLSPFDARMSIVDLGGANDDLGLRALAEAGNGRVVSLDPMLSASGQALQILSSHYREILVQPKLTLPEGMTAASPLPSALAAGDEVVIATQAKAGTSGDVVLSGMVSGQPFEARYPIKVSGDKTSNTFVPGEWAAQRIAALELEPEPQKSEIVRLSKRYGVLSRYTTLLALESKEMMQDYGVSSRKRTTWTGDSEAEAEDSSAASEFAGAEDEAEKMPSPSRTASAPRPAMKSKDSAPMKKSSVKGLGTSGILGLDGGGGAADSFEPMPQRRPRRRMYRPWRRVTTVSKSAATTDWERKNAKKHVERLDRDDRNRSQRMHAIRALIRAEQTDDARRLVREWLNMNPMDPEAIVQDAQLLALAGDIDAYFARLVTASDAAPRGRWLQERIRAAAVAQQDDALRCAMDVALEATEKRPPKSPADILACPMTSPTHIWFGGEAVSTPVQAEKAATGGQLAITLQSSGGDWDIMVLEPSGRPLWWGSARRRIKTANVVGSKLEESMSIPSLKKGTYSILAVPRTGRPGDQLEVSVKGGGTVRRFSVTAPTSSAFEVAEAKFEMRR